METLVEVGGYGFGSGEGVGYWEVAVFGGCGGEEFVGVVGGYVAPVVVGGVGGLDPKLLEDELLLLPPGEPPSQVFSGICLLDDLGRNGLLPGRRAIIFADDVAEVGGGEEAVVVGEQGEELFEFHGVLIWRKGLVAKSRLRVVHEAIDFLRISTSVVLTRSCEARR